jgi:hypothetical protein
MVHSMTGWRAWPRGAIVLAGLAGASLAHASSDPLDASVPNQAIEARFNAAAQQTLVTGRAAPDLCFSLSLPEEWRRTEEGLKAVRSDASLALGLRSAEELSALPQPDLAGRDAAALQQDYEGLLGRPAQSISLSTDAGATRWSATWVDANLPMASHAMTVETLIVPLSNAWVLELSLSGVETREAYDALAARLLARLRVQGRASCQG